MRAQFVLKEIAVGLRRNLTMTIAVIVTVAVSLAMFGAGLLIRAQVNEMKDDWYDRVEVSIFLCQDIDAPTKPSCAAGAVTETQRTAIESELRSMGEVDEVFYESSEDAYAAFVENFAGSAIVDDVTPDQLPSSFRVKLVDPEQFGIVSSAFDSRDGVETVIDQKEQLEPIFRFLNGITIGALAAAGLLLIVTILLVVNTIRVAAFSRRRETGIMRLVGASNLYIQVPFLLEGAIAGFLGALVASGLVAAAYQFLVLGLIKPEFAFVRWVSWDSVIFIVAILLLTGVLISVMASFFTLRRYLKV